MIMRAPIRNQRSKGIKVKHVLQICLLLGVCFWLFYQVKHSQDKKKEFDDKDANVSVKAHSDDEILKLVRKDLPQVQEVAKNEKHEEEEEEKEVRKHEDEDHKEANKNEEVGHEDEEQEEANMQEQVQKEAGSKHEDKEEQEEETKNEETEEEKRESGNEEMDEQDQEKTEDEADREEEFMDQEKEREGDSDDGENEVNEGEEKDSQVENENLLDDNDHDVGDRNAHVAREEHYKADDASSAVSHDNQIIISETEKTSSENSNENSEKGISENTKEINGNHQSTGFKLGEGEMDESGSTLNVTTAEDSSLINATNISTEAVTEISNSAGLSTKINGSLQNGTETMSDSNQAENATLTGATNLEAPNQQTELEQANKNNLISDGNQYDSNSTISIKTVNASGDTFNNSEPILSEKNINLNATSDREVTSGSAMNETANKSNSISDGNQYDSNSTISIKTVNASGDSFKNPEPILSEKNINLNATSDGGVTSGSAMNETAKTTQTESLNSDYESGGANESSDSSSTQRTVDGNGGNESGEMTESLNSSSKNEIVDAAKDVLIDSSDSSVVQDDKETQINLKTLPDIRNTADDGKDVAAE